MPSGAVHLTTKTRRQVYSAHRYIYNNFNIIHTFIPTVIYGTKKLVLKISFLEAGPSTRDLLRPTESQLLDSEGSSVDYRTVSQSAAE